MKKMFMLLVSSLLILTSCKENVKTQVDDKTEIVQEDDKLPEVVKESMNEDINNKNNFTPNPQNQYFPKIELTGFSEDDLKKKFNISNDNDKIELSKFNVAVVPQPTPKNGFSPYDKYYGKGIYNNNSGNSFVIKNSNTTDAVVLLVDANSGGKIRNEFIRKGTTFEMSGVPNGTYYLEWFSGTNWYSDLKVVSIFKGGFQTGFSFTKLKDTKDWMKVDGYMQWTLTLYSVVGGDVESENIDASDFFN